MPELIADLTHLVDIVYPALKSAVAGAASIAPWWAWIGAALMLVVYSVVHACEREKIDG